MTKAKETISGSQMLVEGDHVLVGLSGGADSVCLSIVLDKLKAEYNLKLSAVYIDHGLRPDEVRGEIEFCKDFCESRNIGFIVRQAGMEKGGSNIQETARDIRYRIYDEVSSEINASKVALGHTADDQAETVLMRLIRGSGRTGLSGIPHTRGKIIRPLIKLSRTEIEDFLAHNPSLITHNASRPFIIDSSNLKDKYFRNWLRINIMKDIREKNPAAVADICRTADILREEDEYLEIIVTKTLMRLISRKNDDSIQLFSIPLETIEKPVLRRVLRRAVDSVEGLRGIGLVHIDSVITLIKKGKPGDRITLPKNIRVVKEYSLLKITRTSPIAIGEYEISPPCELYISETGTVINAEFGSDAQDNDDNSTILIDADRVILPLKVRHREAGDFFCPAGFGKRKKIQDFLVDEKVPRDERDSIPIVLSGNDIIWVAGFRADERFRATEKTEKHLRLTIRQNL